jgi:nucleotidyltransferase/DNA polymerase involved in DNA repair
MRIAPRAALANAANHIAKKDEKHGGAVLLLDEAAQDAALARLELTDLWGIAGRLAARLKAIGINTPLDLKRADPRLIRERLGVVTMRLAVELRGVPCLSLEKEIPDRKSIMASRSFGRSPATLRRSAHPVPRPNRHPLPASGRHDCNRPHRQIARRLPPRSTLTTATSRSLYRARNKPVRVLADGVWNSGWTRCPEVTTRFEMESPAPADRVT